MAKLATCSKQGKYTVKPPNNGHIGGRSLVHCREVVLISEVKNTLYIYGKSNRCHDMCPLLGEVSLYIKGNTREYRNNDHVNLHCVFYVFV